MRDALRRVTHSVLFTCRALEVFALSAMRLISRLRVLAEMPEAEHLATSSSHNTECRSVGIIAKRSSATSPFVGSGADPLRMQTDSHQPVSENGKRFSQSGRTLTGHARDLSLLLDASNAFASSRNLSDLLKALGQKMTDSVQSTYCTISLVVEQQACLAIRGFYALRDLAWESRIGQTFPIDSLLWHKQAIVRGEHIVVTLDNPEIEMEDCERSLLFHPGVCSVLLMPLSAKGHAVGVASLGEMRSRERTPFTDEKIELCRAMAWQGALAIENIYAVEAIAHQRQQMQLIIDNVADGVFSTDAEGCILTFNPAAERITGYPASAVVGHKCADMLQGQDTEGCPLCGSQCPTQQILHSSNTAQPLTYREWIIRQDGTKIPTAHSVSPVIDQKKQIIGTVSVIRDVSREEELIRLKSDFISLVSHQIRTPLAHIQASAELLISRAWDESFKNDLLQNLHEQSKRLTRLVNQVLEASRLESGQIKQILEPLVLPPLVEQTVNMYQSQLLGHDLQIQFPNTLPIVLGDRTSVEIVLENLIHNAVNYSPAGGTITLSAQTRGDYVVITVADQGPGIATDQMDSIFQRFHRAATPTRQQVSGFGLGLYIAKLLVEAQGGTIGVESEPGQGARFHFTLKTLGEQ